ncbi:flagellar assembly protein FliH [Undibacterium sp. Di24W]|uniref:flagellar assembly protein FliH n=1 Tax=Undibacterium sp. Di24W TaxID=3413033 RepID=UPI003BF196B0
MSNALPKELQTAFQRWEMPSFGDVRPTHLEKMAEQEQITLADISAIKEQAKNEAYADAYKEAYAIGYQEGQEAGKIEMQKQTILVTSQLGDLKNAFEEQLLNAQNTIGHDLIKLALELASAMTKYRFEQFPEAIADIVKEAIATLPSIQQPAQIFLNPEDLQMVKDQMGDSLERDAWRLLPDHLMTRGGCRIETAQNLLDASFETRWSRLTQALLDLHPSR